MAENNNQLKEAKQLLEELNRLRTQLNKEPLKLTDEQALRQLKSLPGDIEATRRELEAAEFTASGLYSILRGITSEFKGQKSGVLKVRGAFRQLEDAAQDLKLDEQNILDLNKDQVSALEDKLSRSRAIIDQEARSVINGNHIAKNLDQEVQAKIKAGESSDKVNDYIANTLKNSESLSEEQKGLLQAYLEQSSVIDGILDKTRKRLSLEDKISDLVGVTGALVEGTGALMQRLGMRSGIFQDAMQESAETMRQMAKDTATGLQSFNRLNIAAKGFSVIVKGFSKALSDPAVIVAKILDAFLDVNKASVEFGRLTGQDASAVSGLNTRLATSVEVLQTAAELTRQIGLSATSIFSPDDLGRLAEAKNLLGISSEQAGNLGLRAKVAGQAIGDYQDSLLAGVDAGNRLTKSAVAPGIALQDALSVSDGITLSFGKNTKELGKAVTSARALGLELGRVDQIAESLLDFESSIESELEAQLLTGKQINLAKSRELALNNDLAGLSQELAKNGASAVEFANMNRIKQNALAKALGMSRDELAKTILTQEAAATLTDEQREKVLGVTKEQLHQLDVQQKLEKSLNKLAQAFAPVLDIVIPIVDAISAVLTPLANLISKFTNFLDGLKDTSKEAYNLKNIFVDILKLGFGGTVLFGLRPLIGGIVKVGKSILGLGGTAEKTSQSIFASFSDKFKNLKSSFTNIFKSKASEAAANTVQSTVTKDVQGQFRDAKGRFAKAPEIVKDKAVGKTEELAGKAKGQEKGLSAVEKFNKLDTKSMLRGAAAIAVLSGALFISAKAFQEFADVTWESVAQGLVVIGGLTVAAFALSKLKGPIIEGALAIAVLGVTLIPLAAALRIATPAFQAFGEVLKVSLAGVGNILQVTFSGITSLVESVGNSLQQFFDSISLSKIGSLALLGPALISAAAGLTLFGATLSGVNIATGISSILSGGGVLNSLEKLAGMTQPLSTVGVSLTAIAAGIAGIAAALATLETEKLDELKDLVITTAFSAPAIAATGAITELISGITGGSQEQSSNKELVDKMNELIAAVKAGGNVYMDGNKVGQALVLASTKFS